MLTSASPVLDPIPTTGLTAADVDELTRTTRDLMLKELFALTAQARGSPIPLPTDTEKNGTAKASGVEIKAAS